MPRIPLLPDGGLDAAQQRVFDKITSGPRGTVVGPLRAALHSPELADRWQSLGEFLRFNSSLSARQSELAILVCGRHWNSRLEWYIHSDIALRSGVDPDIVDSIRIAKLPDFRKYDEACVYEYSRQLLEFGAVDSSAYAHTLDAFGTVGIVELTALVGYYSMVSMTLNAHHVPSPDSDPAPLRHLDPVAHQEDGRPTRLPAYASHAMAKLHGA